ncbi:MAG TPA: hypothetical protein VME24_05710 [Alphaproteobacteria bacterium]|nr:hypothetical protein [Alphaproteobacteria bacterium]
MPLQPSQTLRPPDRIQNSNTVNDVNGTNEVLVNVNTNATYPRLMELSEYG